jgi:hypothetical protein
MLILSSLPNATKLYDTKYIDDLVFHFGGLEDRLGSFMDTIYHLREFPMSITNRYFTSFFINLSSASFTD